MANRAPPDPAPIIQLFRVTLLAGLLAGIGLAAEGGHSPDTGYGPNPTLPAPNQHLIPTIEIAEARGWPAGRTPIPAPGFAVQAFADGLDHPRTILVLPNGDALVAETNGPPRPEDRKGIKGRLMQSGSARRL